MHRVAVWVAVEHLNITEVYAIAYIDCMFCQRRSSHITTPEGTLMLLVHWADWEISQALAEGALTCPQEMWRGCFFLSSAGVGSTTCLKPCHVDPRSRTSRWRAHLRRQVTLQSISNSLQGSRRAELHKGCTISWSRLRPCIGPAFILVQKTIYIGDACGSP